MTYRKLCEVMRVLSRNGMLSHLLLVMNGFVGLPSSKNQKHEQNILRDSAQISEMAKRDPVVGQAVRIEILTEQNGFERFRTVLDNTWPYRAHLHQ